MITGVHTMFYTSEPDALRAFLRDKLRLPATDVGGGWLIFDLPDAEMGVHPEDPAKGAKSGQHHVRARGSECLSRSLTDACGCADHHGCSSRQIARHH